MIYYHTIQQEILEDESNYLLNYGSGVERKTMSTQFYQEPIMRFDKSFVGAISIQMGEQ